MIYDLSFVDKVQVDFKEVLLYYQTLNEMKREG